jgi:hypothetical protein
MSPIRCRKRKKVFRTSGSVAAESDWGPRPATTFFFEGFVFCLVVCPREIVPTLCGWQERKRRVTCSCLAYLYFFHYSGSPAQTASHGKEKRQKNNNLLMTFSQTQRSEIQSQGNFSFFFLRYGKEGTLCFTRSSHSKYSTVLLTRMFKAVGVD